MYVLSPFSQAKMMGRKALEAAQILIDDLQLGGRITAEEFLKDREQVGTFIGSHLHSYKLIKSC